MVCAHCGHDHRTEDCPNFCKLCEVVGHRQKSANSLFHVCKKCNTIGHSARACKAPQLQQRLVRGERELENDHSQSDAPMATDDAEQELIGGDDPVCKSCGNFGHRSHRDHKCPNHHCAALIDGTAQHLPGRGSINGAFMHGHCNIALSRVRNRESLAILVDETNLVTDPTTGKRAARTTTIVCRTILDM